MNLRVGLSLFATALAAASMGVAVPSDAQPVVQALPNPAQLRLREALRTLARDPGSVPALLEAGRSSVGLGDLEAALGFFRRAEAVAPADGGVKAGLASVAVRQGQALEALRLFAEAEAAGEAMQIYAAERGLAFDLVGDNAHAQQQYAISLAMGADPEVVRRMAMSQAIAGDQRASEATLLPLLQTSDLAAYRTRAFALAVLGKDDEAVSIAETMLPQRLSSRLAPYLRYMPRLTRAQQAAAANLGVFPRAAEIGRDDPAIAAYAAPAAAVPPARTADARLTPSGQPLGNRESAQGGVPRREPAPGPDRVFAVAPPATPPVEPAPPPQAEATVQPVAAPAQPVPVEPVVQPVVAAAALPPAEPPVQSVVAAAEPPPAEAPVQPAVAAAEPPLVGPVDEQPAAVVVAALPQSTPAEEAPRPSISLPPPAAAAAPPNEVDLAAAFADFNAAATPPPAPVVGAVDITTITPRRETPRPATPPPPAKPVVPSRQWVQVATGRDVAALEFDWRRIKRNAGGLLDKYKPHVAAWGQTNRLVAGPFASAGEAQEFVAKLKDKQLDSFRFTSAQGEEVRPLE
jgi:Flp pilus assembly protein TadD